MLVRNYFRITALCCKCTLRCTVFGVFHVNCESQDEIWLKFHKFQSFNIVNSKGNGIFGKLIRPAIPCRIYFCSATTNFLETQMKLHLNRISKRMTVERLLGILFLCGVEMIKRFVSDHLHCMVSSLKKDKQNVEVVLLEKFLRSSWQWLIVFARDWMSLSLAGKTNRKTVRYVWPMFSHSVMTCFFINDLRKIFGTSPLNF